jgi:hypothetical protein
MAKNTDNKKFWGMIIYEKVGDGCFIGLWNNNDKSKHGRIFNEITRKVDDLADKIVGNYVCSWIDSINEPISALLKISRINNIEYSFHWFDSNHNVLFRGIGMEIGLHNIAVTYWYGDEHSLTLALQ